MKSNMLRQLIATAVLPLLLISACQAKEKFNVDFAFGWGNCFRPMEWTPVEVGISSNLTEPFGGRLNLRVQGDELTNLNIVHPFVLTPDMPLRIPLVTKVAFATNDCQLSIVDKDGRVRWDHKYDLWGSMYSPSQIMTIVKENDLLIGLIGKRPASLSKVEEQLACENKTGNRQPGKVYIKSKLPRSAPWDWTGYSSLNGLILNNPDWDLIKPQQAQAIAKWVTNGGSLMVILGSNPLPRNHPIAKLLPFKIGKASKVQLSAATLKSLGFANNKPSSVICQSLEPTAKAQRWQIDRGTNGEVLSASGFAGFGKVRVLTFAPSSLKFKKLSQKKLKKAPAGLWKDQLNTMLSVQAGQSIRLADGTDVDDYNHFYQQGVGNRGLTGVFEFLLNIPELQPISIMWVIVLLLLLGVLLGPLDYLILKKLDRQPLTWITSAVCIALFTVLAYYSVHAIRSGDTQVRVVSLTDGVEGTNDVWSTSYMGIFASDSDEYQIQDLNRNQWWSSIAPSENDMYYYSARSAMRSITCVQQDGCCLPTPLPINIWSMQCMMNQSSKRQMPFAATVVQDKDDFSLTIINRSDKAIKNVEVRVKGTGPNGQRRFKFDGSTSIPSGQRREFSAKGAGYNCHRWEQTINSSSQNISSSTVFCAQGSLRRTRSIEEYIAQGAAVVCVEFEPAPVPDALADQKYDSMHIQFARLVVFPRTIGNLKDTKSADNNSAATGQSVSMKTSKAPAGVMGEK